MNENWKLVTLTVWTYGQKSLEGKKSLQQFSRQEHWSGLPVPPFSRVIFPTQGSNPGLLHCRQILYLLSHLGSLLRESHNQTVILPSITFLFLLPSAYRSLSFCTAPHISFLSATLDAAQFKLISAQINYWKC